MRIALRTAVVSAAVASVAACSAGGAEVEPEGTRQPPTGGAEVEREEAPPPSRAAEAAVELDQGAALSAAAAYRAILARWEAQDEAGYLAGFSSTLECLHGEATAPRTRIEARAGSSAGDRLHPVELRALRATASEVLLLDRGLWYLGMSWVRTHEKLVLMRRADDVWRVVAETSAADPGAPRQCAAMAEEVPPAAEVFARCAEPTDRCGRRCRRGASSQASGNFLHVCVEDCAQAALHCFGLAEGDVPEYVFPETARLFGAR